MSATDPDNQGRVRIEDLCFYFDSQAKDRLDAGAIGRRSGEVLAVREQLLDLPEPEFDAAMKTIRKLVAKPTIAKPDPAEHRKQSQMLFERVDAGASAGHSDEVSKI